MAQYSCQDGFVLVGDQVRVCQEDGNWTGMEPSCLAGEILIHVHVLHVTNINLATCSATNELGLEEAVLLTVLSARVGCNRSVCNKMVIRKWLLE